MYNLQFWWLIGHNHWNWKFAKSIPQITAFYAKHDSQLQLVVDHNHENLKFIKSAPQLTPNSNVLLKQSTAQQRRTNTKRIWDAQGRSGLVQFVSCDTSCTHPNRHCNTHSGQSPLFVVVVWEPVKQNNSQYLWPTADFFPGICWS